MAERWRPLVSLYKVNLTSCDCTSRIPIPKNRQQKNAVCVRLNKGSVFVHMIEITQINALEWVSP